MPELGSQKLDTGEMIAVERARGAWQATVVLGAGALAGLACHAIGDTPDEAVAQLRSFVAQKRRSAERAFRARVEAVQREAALAIAHRHTNPPVVIEPGKPVDLRPPKH